MIHHQELVVGDRTVDLLEPEGPLTGAGDTLEALHEQVKELLARGRRDLCISCRLVTLINSSGLGALFAAYTSTKRAGGRFMVDPQGNDRVRRLLEITQLTFDNDGQPGPRPS